MAWKAASPEAYVREGAPMRAERMASKRVVFGALSRE